MLKVRSMRISVEIPYLHRPIQSINCQLMRPVWKTALMFKPVAKTAPIFAPDVKTGTTFAPGAKNCTYFCARCKNCTVSIISLLPWLSGWLRRQLTQKETYKAFLRPICDGPSAQVPVAPPLLRFLLYILRFKLDDLLLRDFLAERLRCLPFELQCLKFHTTRQLYCALLRFGNTEHRTAVDPTKVPHGAQFFVLSW
jgi:hypothetical protein